MTTETNLHADDWKSGTEAVALCMICGGEYPIEARECPDCNVSLSVVRRCPSCQKIVSAQHRKCVYCRTPFVEEVSPPRPEEPAGLNDPAVGAGVRRFRAAVVSISTFLIVFGLGMFFLRRINNPLFTTQVIAKAQIVHSAQLRRAPSSSASNVAKVGSGTAVNLTGFQESDQGRWMAVDWGGMTAYVPAGDVSAPRAVDADEGAKALEFYISGMATTDSADGAIAAVDDYGKAFPGDPHLDELRWVLAERLQVLAQRGGAQGAELRRQASQQLEELAAGKGSFADKARGALERPSSGAHPAARLGPAAPRNDGLQIIGGAGTETSIAHSAPHNVLVLTQAEVRVRTGKLSQLSSGGVVTGHVASPVKTNGIMAIPAGAPCQLAVLSADPSAAKLSLALTSIEIDQRSYPVQSSPVEVRSGKGEAAISFHLEAPILIER